MHGRLALPVLPALAAAGAWAGTGAPERPTGHRAIAAGASAGGAGAAARRAEWCAEPAPRDRPAVAPGPSVHIVYAVPFDGPDRFAEEGPLIAADVEAIERWWRREDPARVPRFDRYEAGCGRQLDISRVRLGEAGASYARYAVIGDLVDTEISVSGFDDAGTLYLVYYDGPTGLAEVCGEAGGDPELRLGRALVYLGTCGELDRARVVAHELVHALGALPDGAPHACGDDAGHPCDFDADLLWPRVDGRPLEEVRLDVGRDDYYAHAGGWWDARDSVFLRRLDERTRLVVEVSGGGTVTSPLPGVAPCTRRCVTRFDGPSTVWLRPRAAPGRRFLRWEGACTARPCVLRLDGRRAAVTAVFGRAG